MSVATLEIIRWLQHFESPGLTAVFRLITDLNSESFYIVALAFLYWCLDRQTAYRLAVLFLSSAWANGGLKGFFHTARPPETAVRHLVVQTDPAFPSGHAQGTTVFWGYLALTYRRRWLARTAAAVVALVSLSRLYLGVHWLQDLGGGILIGLAILGLAALVGRYETGTWAEFPWGLQILLATFAPLALLVFYRGPVAAVMVGAMSGLGLGHFLNERFVRSATRAPWPVQAMKIGGGLLLIVAIRLGLKALFPAGEVWDLARYAVVGFAAAYLWPWVFTRFGGAFATPESGRASG